MVARREIPQTGILQEWVARLGLRHQGVLLTVVRGCDTAPKHDASKDLTRAIRGVLLNTHCLNPEDAKSFIEFCRTPELQKRMDAFRASVDQYPHHFVMHTIHACEVIGYHHPAPEIAHVFEKFYRRCCKSLHTTPETREELDARLNADEHVFAVAQ